MIKYFNFENEIEKIEKKFDKLNNNQELKFDKINKIK